MNPTAIFFPMIALALLTGLVLALTGCRRIGAVVSKRLRTSDFKLAESANVPAEIAVCNRNFMNLLEMPVLFYVVSVSLYVTGHVDKIAVALAWSYFAMRLAHSSIHVTSNAVVARLAFFATSNLVLLALWIMLMVRL